MLLRQLQEVDSNVKNQLGAEARDQDAALNRRLEARRRKREKAIERERLQKQANLQERIEYSLANSSEYALKKNKLTAEGLESIIQKMKLELSSVEIPAALERLIDDKHQKELQDWLLKLYEQKAIELKEEILAMMEEKIARQMLLKKNCEDRKRGLEAIMRRTPDAAQKRELAERVKKLESEVEAEVAAMELEYRRREAGKTKEI